MIHWVHPSISDPDPCSSDPVSLTTTIPSPHLSISVNDHVYTILQADNSSILNI